MNFDFGIIKCPPARKNGRLDREKARRLYEAGKNDCEIARACGVTRLTVRNFRLREGLPTRYRRRRNEKAEV